MIIPSAAHALSGKRALALAVNTAQRGAPEAAFDELLPWVDSLLGNVDVAFGEKANLLFALDEALQRPAHRCTDLYLAACADAMPERQRHLCAKQLEAWKLVLDGYGELLITLAAGAESVAPEFVAQLAVRAMRAASHLAEWQAFQGEASDQNLWARMNLAYRLAEQVGVARQVVSLRQDRDLVMSAEREYVRAMAFHSLGPEQLDVESLVLAARLVHYVLAQLELSPVPGTASLYWVDAAQAVAPVRIVELPNRLAMPRFFAGALAINALQSLLELASAGHVPPGFVLRHAPDNGGFAGVLTHMIRRWSDVSPLRRQRRHEMPTRMAGVAGIANVLARLAGEADGEVPSQWQVHDVSRQGIGVDVPQSQTGGVRAGTLVGMCPEDACHWRIGTVRRIRRGGAGDARVGIELFAENATFVVVREGTLQIRALLLGGLNPGATVRLILPRAATAASPALFLSDNGDTYRLALLPGREYGADHEICTCVVHLA